jgi:hypothetical protein
MGAEEAQRPTDERWVATLSHDVRRLGSLLRMQFGLVCLAPRGRESAGSSQCPTDRPAIPCSRAPDVQCTSVGTAWHAVGLLVAVYATWGVRAAGMSFAVSSGVLSSKQLLRNAMVGFALGVVVMAGVALMSRSNRDNGAQAR